MTNSDDARTWICCNCRTSLRGVAQLRFGNAFKGSNGMCISCADKLAAQGHHTNLHDFMAAYVKANRRETETQQLRNEVKQLRAMLDQLTKPEIKHPDQMGRK